MCDARVTHSKPCPSIAPQRVLPSAGWLRMWQSPSVLSRNAFFVLGDELVKRYQRRATPALRGVACLCLCRGLAWYTMAHLLACACRNEATRARPDRKFSLPQFLLFQVALQLTQCSGLCTCTARTWRATPFPHATVVAVAQPACGFTAGTRALRARACMNFFPNTRHLVRCNTPFGPQVPYTLHTRAAARSSRDTGSIYLIHTTNEAGTVQSKSHHTCRRKSCQGSPHSTLPYSYPMPWTACCFFFSLICLFSFFFFGGIFCLCESR